MALAPAPLDEVFEHGVDSAEFMDHKLIKRALNLANKAYLDRKVHIEKNPGICTGSPAQAARVAFLQVIES